MRLSLFSLGMLLALTLIVTGCGGGKKADTPSPGTQTPDEKATPPSAPQTSGVTAHPSQEVVRQFLLAMVQENTKEAFALFTPKAQEEYRKTGAKLDPEVFHGMAFHITGGDEVPDAGVGFYAVYVDIVNEGELIDAVWGVRKIGNEYRIANLMMNFGGDFVKINFEDPAGTLSALAGEFNEQQPSMNQVPIMNQPTMPQSPPQIAQPNMPNFQ